MLVVGLAVAACNRSAGPITTVSAAPPPPSPEQRDQRNRLDVRYQLASPAEIWARIEDATGQHWQIHTGALRPRAGEYVLHFDGTVPGPTPNERRVLADGEYRIVIDAVAQGQAQRAEVPLVVREADLSLPEVSDLTLLPDHITPDFDARDDVTHVSFRLAKDARVALFLDRVEPGLGPGRVWMGEEVNLQAGEQALVWDGLASGQPVPTGAYQLGVRARDSAGNIVEGSQPLVVEESGVPTATILSARIGPRRIIRGEQLCLDVVVRNTGQTVLRTEGPDPGYVYNSMDTYSSIEDHRFGEHAGLWRVGLNWSGSPDTTRATYPYRWGLGKDLQPGEEVAVNGCVKILQEQDKLVFFAALIQENVAIHSAGAGLVRVEISS